MKVFIYISWHLERASFDKIDSMGLVCNVDFTLKDTR
jgi:hypothetical protein